jgi:hypothetical protein
LMNSWIWDFSISVNDIWAPSALPGIGITLLVFSSCYILFSAWQDTTLADIQ